MTIYQKRQRDRFDRSVKYIDAHQSEFSAGSKALSLRDDLKGTLSEFGAAEEQPKAPGTSARSYNSPKLKALNALREDLVAISHSAQVIAKGNPKFKNTFELPDRRRKADIADAARQFIKDATPLKAEFMALEMQPDFLDRLQERLNTYEAAQIGSKPEKGTRTAPTDAVSKLITSGMETLDALNVVVRNKYRGDEKALNSWQSASDVESTPRRKKGEKAAAKKVA